MEKQGGYSMGNLREELLEICFRVKGGDVLAKHELIVYFDPYVRQQIKGYCYKIQYAYGDQEDIYQDTMASLLTCCKSFNLEYCDDFFPYAAKVIANSICTGCKSYNKPSKRLQFLSLNALAEDDTEYLQKYESPHDVEQEVINKLMLEEVRPQIIKGNFNDFERHVLRSLYSGKEPKVIASEANVSVSAYYKCLYRMRRKVVRIRDSYK